MAHIQELHLLRAERQSGSGILLLGQTGAGKTTLLKTVEASFLRRKEAERDITPCVYARIPPRPSIKAMGQVILRALGDPLAFKGGQTTSEVTHRVVTLLSACETELILLDELTHLVDGRRGDSLSSVADWLKELADISKAPLVLAGLPRSEALLLTNEQLRRRFSASLYIEVSNATSREKNFDEFCSVIGEVFRHLSVPRDINVADPDIARRFLYATEGLIGYLVSIAMSAVRICHRAPSRSIDLEVLSQAFREAIWRTPKPRRDPFAPDFNGNRLTGFNEPFAQLAATSSKKAADDSKK